MFPSSCRIKIGPLLVAVMACLLGACTQTSSYVYVANADSREIQVSRLDGRTGEVVPVQTISVKGSVMPMAVSPDHRRLFASLRTAPFSVAAFDIDPKTGRLTHLGDYPLADNMANIATDRTGQLLLSASYGSNKLAVNRIQPDGSVAPAHHVIPTKPMAHSIQPSPDNRFAFATSLGGDEIMQFRLDAGGTLTPNAPAVISTPEKSGPRHLVFHPNGRFAYVLDELDAALRVFAYDSAAGTLAAIQTDSALPKGFTGTPWGSDIHLTPNGRFLYAAERTSSTLSAFRVDDNTGQLTRLNSVPTETQPRGFNIDPSGRYLLAVGQKSDKMAVYAIDQGSGDLKALGRYPTGKNANWVEIISAD